jgi:hypothetical protein
MCFKWLFANEEPENKITALPNCRNCFDLTPNPRIKEDKYFERRFCKFKTCEKEDPRLKSIKSPISF